ncbi:MAG: SH3 domain-containing protein [Steroidobacteraceae bacterium]
MKALPWLIMFFGLAFFSCEALADRVAPSDRVQTGLRIRSDPDVQSTIIGALLPGQSLPLKSSVSGWYEVSLANGDAGFVSKSWARLIPDAAPPIAASAELRLGSWNIRKLGHGDNKNFPLVAEVIESHFDIVAVVEIMQKGGGHPGYDSLISALGQGWNGIVTNQPRPNTSSGSAEFYAILFRPQRVQLCDGWTDLRYAPDDGDVFSREPAFACFVTFTADGSSGFDFLLAAYHARWADGDTVEIQDEVRNLDDVFAAMGATRPGERDLLIAGDFNLVPVDLQETVSRPISTVGTGSTLNSTGAVTSNVYDHLLVFDVTATHEQLEPARVLDVRHVAATNRTFFQTVSDHLPIVARFRIIPDDD